MRRTAAAVALLVGLAGCVNTGTTAGDEAVYEARIVAACLASPLFKAADGALTMAVPAATLPVDLVNAGVSIVCANPAHFAALDAKTDAWVRNVLAPHTPKALP